jgi:hypothetical protein
MIRPSPADPQGESVNCKHTRRTALAAALGFCLPALVLGQDTNRTHPTGDVPLTIVQTTDLHDHANGLDHLGLDVNPVTATSRNGSYARIAAYVNFVRSSAGHSVVLVDSGDWSMGTVYDLTLGSRPLALRFIREMQYDCVTLGNHEFDYTPKGLARTLGAAVSGFAFRTPMVASNMNLNGDKDLAPFVGDGKLIQTTRLEHLSNGLTIGYLGLMGKAAAVDAPGSSPVSFTTDYAAIQQLVDGLRKSGANVVIALSHSGTNATGTSGEDVDTARQVTGIDVIASGHTHTPLPGVSVVANGSWSTAIIDAGAFGTNVARLDLVYHSATKSSSFTFANNLAMNDATLRSIHTGPHRWLVADPATTALVSATDKVLNQELGPFFSATFPDYDPANIGTGLYHPVGVSTQDMVSNANDPVLAPSGLGSLAADGLRNIPNALIGEAIEGGANPSNSPGFDFTPFQASVVATGVIRGKLLGGVPLSFVDVYNVLPLGISPDPTQALPVGFPTLSAYLSVGDLEKLCALQLLAQANLVQSDFYLNLSGVQYGLSDAGTDTFFKFATAAAVLEITSQKALNGSADAQHALAALAGLASDQGASLLAAAALGNPYAIAMTNLNDTTSGSQVGPNLQVLGQVAGAAAADAARGTTTLDALLVARAVGAITGVSGFAPTDLTNTGSTVPLTDANRVRIAVDLYAVLLLGAVEEQFGVSITPFSGPTGTTALSGSDFAGLLANRIDASPAAGGVQELKEWMALLGDISQGLGGKIGTTYASTPNFAQFGQFGAAVKTRNASYPIVSIGQLATTLGGLEAAP